MQDFNSSRASSTRLSQKILDFTLRKFLTLTFEVFRFETVAPLVEHILPLKMVELNVMVYITLEPQKVWLKFSMSSFHLVISTWYVTLGNKAITKFGNYKTVFVFRIS